MYIFYSSLFPVRNRFRKNFSKIPFLLYMSGIWRLLKTPYTRRDAKTRCPDLLSCYTARHFTFSPKLRLLTLILCVELKCGPNKRRQPFTMYPACIYLKCQPSWQCANYWSNPKKSRAGKLKSVLYRAIRPWSLNYYICVEHKPSSSSPSSCSIDIIQFDQFDTV